jgi:hypothetical protein
MEMRLARQVVGILVLVAVIALPVVMAVAQQVNPAGVVLANGGINPYNVTPFRNLSNTTVEQGQTFNVTINFTAPADMFYAIMLHDIAPDGWNVSGEKAWCTPNPNLHVLEDNTATIQWTGEGPDFFDNGTQFIARYQVDVPCNASVGPHTFNLSTPFDVYLDYYVVTGGSNGPWTANITGEYDVTVIGPTINFIPESIDFYGAVNGTNPQNQTLELWSSTQRMLNWSLSDDADWLSKSPESGNCTYDEHSSVALSVNSSGMPAGNYSANLTINAPEANNFNQTINVTLRMRETSILEGRVTFPVARVGSLVEPFEVKLFQPNTMNVIWAGNATTNSTGVFTISGVVVATYDVGIKNATCLSELEANITVTGDTTSVVNFTIREGDIDDSDYIDMGDYSALSTAFNTLPGYGNWNANADLDRSGYIDMGDYSMFSAHFNEIGDAWGQF